MSSPQIKTITIHDFKGFAGESVPSIDLEGKNLLLYGENGSGKTTIFTALAEMLNPRSPRRFDDDVTNAFCLKHRLSPPSVGCGKVSLAFQQNGANRSLASPMEWRINQPRPEAHPYYSQMSRSSGFLDYRAILRTHFLDYENDNINLFSLIVETLFRDVEMPAMSSPVTFGQEWQEVQELQKNLMDILAIDPTTIDVKNPDYLSITAQIGFDPREYQGEDDEEEDDGEQSEREIFSRFVEEKKEECRERCAGLSEKIQQRLSEIAGIANAYLKEFDPWLEIDFLVTNSCFPTDDDSLKQKGWRNRAQLPLKARYRGLSLDNPGTLLNEARLTAIALTFYLAALKVQTPTSTPYTAPRLLVLDDVLIGLDMTHRLPVLDLLKTAFAECHWQVLLFTFDKTWFEVAKQRLNGWQFYELFAISVGDYEQPMLLPCKDHLDRARLFLDAGEVKAAAVHVRTKFEMVLKVACEEFKIPVRYRSDNRYEAGDFWNVLRGYEWSQPDRDFRIDRNGNIIECKSVVKHSLLSSALEAAIQHSLSWVMNPLSHSQNINPYRDEILKAVSAVEELERAIKYARKMRGTPATNDLKNLKQLGQILVNILENIIKEKAAAR